VPPFYGSVSRGAATIHPRFVHDPAALGPASEEGSLVAAYVEVDDVKALYAEYVEAGVDFAKKLGRGAWGGSDLMVVDPDGHGVCFVTGP